MRSLLNSFHSDGVSHTIYTISMSLSILYFTRGIRSKFINLSIFLYLKIDCFITANSADPGEIPHYEAFLCNVPVYRYTEIKRVKKIISEPWHRISNNGVCATSKASDQPAHTRGLIRAFASRLNIL